MFLSINNYLYSKSSALFFLVILGLSTIVSCGNSSKQKIGVLLPKSKYSPYYGAREGIELAQKILEAEDQTIIFKNATCDQTEDLAKGEALITQENVIAIIGGCDKTSLLLAELADKHQIVFITPTSSRTDLKQREYTFQILTSDQQQISFTAKTIINEGLTQLGIIHENNSYNQTYAKKLREEFEKINGKVEIFEAYNEDNLSTILKQLKLKNIDSFFFAFNDPEKVKTILEKMNNLSFRNLISPTLFGSEKLKILSIANAKGSDGLMIISSQAGNQNFFTHFFENNKTLPTLYSAEGYASFQLLYKLINSGVENGEDLKNKLITSKIDTSIGEIKFDDNHSISRKVNLYVIINGEFLKR